MKAFPIDGDMIALDKYHGMDLRDYFAAKALSGLLSEDKCYYNAVASQAYLYADAMMEQRSKRESKKS